MTSLVDLFGIPNLNELGALGIMLLIGKLYLLYFISSILAVYLYQKSIKYGSKTSGDDICNGMNLKDKTFIITGASAGLGKETARILLKYGGTVIMANRNENKTNKAINELKNRLLKENNISIDDKQLQFYKIDLSSLKSINEFAKNIINSDIKNIHYLINNAGVMAQPTYQTTKDNIEWQWGINHLGHYYMTTLLLPKLIKSKTRIVNLSSFGHMFGVYSKASTLIDYCINNKCYMGKLCDTYAPAYAYGISKASNILFTKYINKTYNNNGIYSIAVHPGGINTELARDVRLTYQFFKEAVGFLGMFLLKPYFIPYDIKNIECGVSTTLRACFVSNEFIKNNSIYFSNCNPSPIVTTSIANYDEMVDKVMELSNILIKEKGFKLTLE